MIFLNPIKSFRDGVWENEAEKLIKIQIENSLEMGWKREDIMLVTNFTYEFMGIKSMVVGDENFYEPKPTCSKMVTIINLIKSGVIGNELHWFHDLDAFQLENLGEIDLKYNELALTDYGKTTIHPGRDSRWSTGSLFFRAGALDLFEKIMEEVHKYQCNEEVAMLEMLKKKRHQVDKPRIRKLNITYNFATRKRNIAEQYKIVDKPIKVIHFHPFDKRAVDGDSDNMSALVYGNNSLEMVFVTPRLIQLFKKYGIT